MTTANATRITDPEALEAIEAEFTRVVYEASRRALRQRRGQEPPPVTTPEALTLRKRALELAR